ncbi:ribosome biogenesis GTP-binding protein YihA/YsxC [Texas Phoenix palm phytoplasma]|uniref:ribosome biogenesis GTP-binding protein YihA/YsxC n=1 Tax=Texas Phoenix palm phytoplasma TaxID=176709 RepID=UPI00280A6ED2|nr:ribosome biogenesis GTP-binding protein YihA/YsxC [Texas Phoenix palm phytoplasma]
MIINKCIFVKSIDNLKNRPIPFLKEIFLIGRSNVGKSSFINVLTNKKKISFVSKKPGKTMYLNYFLINDCFYLVDAPGYGYIKKSKKNINNMINILNNFIQNNFYIKIVFQIIDFKVGPTQLDLKIYKLLKEFNFFIILILNKKDKVLKNKVFYRFKEIKKIFFDLYLTDVPMYLFSCKTKEGLNEIIRLIFDRITT